MGDLVFRSDVDRLFAELFPGGRHAASAEARAPVDVYVAEGEPPTLVVELDAAGVDPDMVDISLENGVLVVRGERRRRPDGHRIYHHAEIAWGPFERRLRLGVQVDANATTASYEDGILRIAMPLAPKQPLRRVDISAGETPP
jgi:HSP20 family protein